MASDPASSRSIRFGLDDLVEQVEGFWQRWPESRADEMGQFGTGFTISQIVSLGSILLGFSLLVLGAKVMSRTETLTVDSSNPSEG